MVVVSRVPVGAFVAGCCLWFDAMLICSVRLFV